MQANIELALKTREVFKLFERRIDGDRLFIEAILRKFNVVMKQSKQQMPEAMLAYTQIEQALNTLTQQFFDEVNRFELMLSKRKDFDNKKINFIPQFHTTITINSQLNIRLVEFIEIYDNLIATLKLLHIAGCFTSDNDYDTNLKRIQLLANRMLSTILLMPTLKSQTIQAIPQQGMML